MDFNSDEGFGEMAYLKWGTPDENGDTLNYQWRGLNNSLYYPMKTGFTIFLDTSLPPSVSSPSPDINYVITSDAVNITAMGEGMVKLYIDGEEVTNPYSAVFYSLNEFINNFSSFSFKTNACPYKCI